MFTDPQLTSYVAVHLHGCSWPCEMDHWMHLQVPFQNFAGSLPYVRSCRTIALISCFWTACWQHSCTSHATYCEAKAGQLAPKTTLAETFVLAQTSCTVCPYLRLHLGVQLHLRAYSIARTVYAMYTIHKCPSTHRLDSTKSPSTLLLSFTLYCQGC